MEIEFFKIMCMYFESQRISIKKIRIKKLTCEKNEQNQEKVKNCVYFEII